MEVQKIIMIACAPRLRLVAVCEIVWVSELIAVKIPPWPIFSTPSNSQSASLWISRRRRWSTMRSTSSVVVVSI
jgi:hypothetical protein